VTPAAATITKTAAIPTPPVSCGRPWPACSRRSELAAGQTTDQLTTTLGEHGGAIRPATIQIALARSPWGELATAELVASTGEDGQQ
jgi:hypothetical protein